jgi:RNA polymerase sigma-70 factor (ECF subfamily)
MALQDVEPATETRLGDSDTAAEFDAGLVKLMPFLRAFAQSLSGRGEVAEDLAQEALAKAWRSRHSFRQGSNLKAWLFTILRNEYYSQQRRAWRQSPWDEGLVDTLAAPSEEQQWAVELSDIARAMHGLTDTQREALILVGVGGFSYEEAATHTRTAIGTIKSRVARARQSLKEICDRQTSLPIKSRPTNGNAMKEILAQFSRLCGGDAPQAVVRPASC